MLSLRTLRSCFVSGECSFYTKSIASLQSEVAAVKSPFLKCSFPLVLNLVASAIFSSSLYSHFSFFLSLKSRSSTSKLRVALAGIFGGDPLSPYAYSGEQTRVAFSPFFMLANPSSQPLMTLPCPSTKLKGFSLSQLESKRVPSRRVPLYRANISCPLTGTSPSPS